MFFGYSPANYNNYHNCHIPYIYSNKQNQSSFPIIPGNTSELSACFKTSLEGGWRKWAGYSQKYHVCMKSFGLSSCENAQDNDNWRIKGTTG